MMILVKSALLAVLVLASAAQAQQKPYEPVDVTFDRAAESDPQLKSVIEALHKAVADKNLAALDATLAPGYIALECDADPVKPCAPGVKGATRSNPKLPPPARLRQALCCRDISPAKISKVLREETVLGLIGSALEEETAGATPALPGAACLPAWPVFDTAKAAAIAAAADVENTNLRVTTREILLLDKPAADAAEVARLPAGRIAPLVTDLPDSLPDGWTAIALPQGGIGYTDMTGLNEIAPGGLCFSRNDKGAWQISLTIQRRS